MLIKLKNIQKTYSTKNGVTFRALSNVSTSFDSTGLVYLVGASGSGKSTLLNVIGGLDGYDSGELILAGRDLKSLRNSEVDSLRNTLMGFIFQEFNLIDTLTVFENVKLALDMQSQKDNERIYAALRELGIEDKAKNKTKDLSGGQRQRVAIARALVKNPRIILADEPTGSLDSATSEEVIKILKDLSATRLVIAVTHDMDTAVKTGDRIIEMKDGKIYRDVRRRGEGELIDTSETEFFSQTLMSVPEGAKVTESDAEKINDAIRQSARKTYVTVETDPRKVKAMHPNLREAVDSGAGQKSAKSDSTLEETTFVPYKESGGDMESVTFKKSRLPFKHAVRLGLNNLNFKKARLVLTVIVAFAAFVLFGTAQSFTAYDMRAAIVKTVEHDEIGSVTIASGSGFAISESDLKTLRDKSGMDVIPEYDISFTPTGYVLDYFSQLGGVIEVDDVSRLGLATVYGSSSCSSYGEVIISEFAAMALLRAGALQAEDVSDCVGRTLELVSASSSLSLTIAGIFECKDAETLIREIDYDFDAAETVRRRLEDGWGQLYVKEGFTQSCARKYVEGKSRFAVELSVDGASQENYDNYVYTKFAADGQTLDDVTPIIGAAALNSTYDIVVGSALIERMGYNFGGDGKTIAEIIAEINADPTRRLILRLSDSDGSIAVLATDAFRIVGVTDGAQDTLILHENLIDAIFGKMISSKKARACFGGVKASKAVSAIYDSGFIIRAQFVDNYDTAIIVMQVLRHVLMGLAIGACALVILLLYSFISTSIRLTKKNIGILRALGAKKFDTFKIYAAEGFIVTIFALILAVVAIVVGAPLLNLMMSGVFGHYFSLFTIGARVYITMTALTLAVTVIAVLIPLRKFNRITPVSAISGKD